MADEGNFFNYHSPTIPRGESRASALTNYCLFRPTYGTDSAPNLQAFIRVIGGTAGNTIDEEEEGCYLGCCRARNSGLFREPWGGGGGGGGT